MGAIQQLLASYGGGGGGGGGVTWNPADKSAAISLSGANLIATSDGTSANKLVRATLGRSSGKYYFELSLSGGTDISLGLAESSLSLSGYVGSTAGSYGYYQLNGDKYNNGSSAAFGASFTGAVTIGIAADLGAGLMWFSKANVYQASGNPAAGTNEAFSGLSGTKFPAVNIYNPSISVTGRFKAADLIYSPPAGFSAWE